MGTIRRHGGRRERRAMFEQALRDIPQSMREYNERIVLDIATGRRESLLWMAWRRAWDLVERGSWSIHPVSPRRAVLALEVRRSATQTEVTFLQYRLAEVDAVREAVRRLALSVHTGLELDAMQRLHGAHIGMLVRSFNEFTP